MSRLEHGLLIQLLDDDHPQYMNEDRLAAYLGANPPVPAAHTHVEADVTDLGNYSVVGHGHVEADISDLGSYSVVGHTHVEANITDLGSYLLLSGGTMTGSIDLGAFDLNSVGSIVADGTQLNLEGKASDRSRVALVAKDTNGISEILFGKDGVGTTRRILYDYTNDNFVIYKADGATAVFQIDSNDEVWMPGQIMRTAQWSTAKITDGTSIGTITLPSSIPTSMGNLIIELNGQAGFDSSAVDVKVDITGTNVTSQYGDWVAAGAADFTTIWRRAAVANANVAGQTITFTAKATPGNAYFRLQAKVYAEGA